MLGLDPSISLREGLQSLLLKEILG